MRISKPFEKQGGYTEFDNDILDHIMPELKPSEWMVLCFIIRKTKGWHKDSDAIAYSQFIKGTGISSNSTIKKCLDNLIKKELVMLGTTGHKADAHHYMLNKSYSFSITETVERPVTFSVERPVTETVDTKESFKENINIIQKAFENLTGFFPPYETTDQYQDKWYKPLVAIVNQSRSGDEAVKRVEYAIDAMRNSEKGYHIATPKSILTFALNYQPTQTMAISTDGSVNL